LVEIPAEIMDQTQVASSNAIDLAIVIPAIDERENLELLIPALWDVINGMGVSAEIVLVDGGSKDGTEEAARSRGVRVVRQSERGYGGALLAGFAATNAPYIITMDADLSHRPSFIVEMWKNRNNAHVLIGSRYIAGGEAEMTLSRRILSKILNKTYARVLSLPMKDLSSGFRMYRADTVKHLQLKARDFDVLEEILIKVYAEGWSIIELPFRYMSRGSGRSHAKLLKFGIAYLSTLSRMWRLRNSVESADYDYRAFNSPIWLQRYWQRKRHEIILKFVGDADSVLDIGCGSSRIILDLKNAVGMDILQRKLRWLKPKHERLVRGSTFTLPFKENSFDVVINSEVIEHVPADPKILEEMWRVLRPGGTLVLGTPDYDRWSWVALEWIYGKVLPGAYAHEHITHYTRKGLDETLRANGFEVMDCQYVGFSEMIFQAKKPAKGAQSASTVLLSAAQAGTRS
jgi:dolichol-phosphate mannosyltransferase